MEWSYHMSGSFGFPDFISIYRPFLCSKIKRKMTNQVYNLQCMHVHLCRSKCTLKWNLFDAHRIVCLYMWLTLFFPPPQKKRVIELRKLSFKKIFYNNKRKRFQPANLWHAIFNMLCYCHSLWARLTVLYLFALVFISLGYVYLDRTKIP